MFRRDASGRIINRTRANSEIILNPRSNTVRINESITDRETSTGSKFKLVTVRRMTNNNVDLVTDALINSQILLEQVALQNGLPAPYPAQLPNPSDNLSNYYAVFVDEDLYGRIPVYTFESSSNKIKCFITNNGMGKEDYSVHIIHYLTSVPNEDGTYNKRWRLFTIDNNLLNAAQSNNSYLLESDSLPACFQNNYDIDNVFYLGGGCWTGLALDPSDYIPIKGLVSEDQAAIYRIDPPGSRYATVSRSLTPTYSFTWCRGKLEVNKRIRSASDTLDAAKYIDSKVIEITKKGSYALDIVLRPELDNLNDPIVSNVKNEALEYSALYVGNTNNSIASPYQNPDYGTDVLRYSLANFTVETNVVRRKKQGYGGSSIDKSSAMYLSNAPVLTSASNMNCFIKLDMGIGKGSINHSYELKTGAGKRGISYLDYGKEWYAYGKILQVDTTGDLRLFKFNRITGNLDPTGQTFNDIGQVLLHPDKPNAILTTWEAQTPTARYTPLEGTCNFIYYYLNPPLIGHQACFYYHINPTGADTFNMVPDSYNQDQINQYNLQAPAFGGLGGSFTGSGQTPTQKVNGLRSVYTQILGSLSGATVPSLNIGTVNIAAGDTQSRVVKSPVQSDKLFQVTNPSVFPVGFYDDLRSITIDTNNRQVITLYNSDGAVTNQYTVN